MGAGHYVLRRGPLRQTDNDALLGRYGIFVMTNSAEIGEHVPRSSYGKGCRLINQLVHIGGVRASTQPLWHRPADLKPQAARPICRESVT